MRFRRLEALEFREFAGTFGVADVLRGVPDGPICLVLESGNPTLITFLRVFASEWFHERVVLAIGSRLRPTPTRLRGLEEG